MKRFLIALVLFLAPAAASAQCNGVFPNNTVCGNATGSSNIPRVTSPSAFLGAAGGTNGQQQYNNSGALGGFTQSGDVTVNTSTGVSAIQPGAVTNGKLLAGPINTVKSTLDGTSITDNLVTTLINATCSVIPSACITVFGYVSPVWYGAVADNTTDSGPAFRAAYLAAPNGGRLYIPAGALPYVANSCDADNAVISSVTASPNKAVSIIGDGWNIKTGGSYANPRGSVIRLGASIPNTCSFLRYAGTDIVTGITLRDFAVVASTGTFGTPVGLHGIFIDESVGASAFYLTQMNIDHVFIDNMAAGYSIRVAAVNSGVFSGGLAFSSIRNSQLMSFNATFLGDGVTIDHNTFGQNATVHTRNVGIEFSQVSGATSTTITKNIISNFDGMLIIHGAETPIIRDNEFEQGNTSNSNSSLIFLQSDVAAVNGAVISGNSIAQNSTIGNYAPIALLNANNTTIEGNTIRLLVTYDFITITSSTYTRVNANQCVVLGTIDGNCSLSSLGTLGSKFSALNFRMPFVAVLSLPVCNGASAGTRAVVSDNSVATAFGALIATGGAIFVPVYCDGTAWRQG